MLKAGEGKPGVRRAKQMNILMIIGESYAGEVTQSGFNTAFNAIE